MGENQENGTTAGSPAPRRLVRAADEADRLLSLEPEVRNFETLAEGECWVVSQSIMAPIFVSAPQTVSVQLTDQPQSVEFALDPSATQTAMVLQPPNGTVKLHFQEPDRQLAFWRLVMGAKRIRNTLAFISEIPIPLRHVILTKSLMFRFNHDQDIQRYHPETGSAIQDPSRLEPWYGHVERSFAAASELLSQLPMDSPVNRAISLAGGAVWADDPEDGFLSAWRAVEVVAKLDYSNRDETQSHVGSEATGADTGPWSDAKKVRESLSHRISGVDLNLVNRLIDLRGRIAHDTVNAELYKGLYEQRWVGFNMACQTVRSYLQDRGFAVPDRGPRLNT